MYKTEKFVEWRVKETEVEISGLAYQKQRKLILADDISRDVKLPISFKQIMVNVGKNLNL